jgi:threonylcarbamoyladenosine tRNA methylthiotransferase CDKAL1
MLSDENYNEPLPSSKIYIEGHGCSASLADTEILAGIIQHSKYEIVDDPRNADLAVLVTCSVKSVTEQRMLSRIRDLQKDGRKVIVAGCLAKAEPEKVLAINNRLSLLGPNNLNRIVPAIDSALSGAQFKSIENSNLVKLGLPRSRKNQIVGIVEIASGCLSSCTFCQVKLVKGTVFSYPEREIVKEAELLVQGGCREIWLTSTDNSAFGKDSKTTLANLIRKVCEVPGDFKVRVGMMNPLLTRGKILDDLIAAFSHDKVFKFLHLPVQSGSDRILRLMQRGYGVQDYYETLDAFRSHFPNLTLSTDLIVGFPFEEEIDFEDSLKLLEKSRPDVLNLSRFGAREGTRAAEMPHQTPPTVSKERSKKATMVWKRIARENNLKWLGWRGKVIVDERVVGAFVARNDFYKPCVLKDGQNSGQGIFGRMLEVQVESATPFTLGARVTHAFTDGF